MGPASLQVVLAPASGADPYQATRNSDGTWSGALSAWRYDKQGTP